MAFGLRIVRQKGALLLAFPLFCLLVTYVGWNWRKRIPDGSIGLGKARVTRADKFQFINRVVTALDTEAAATMRRLMTRRAKSRDPQLIDVVRQLIDPPPPEGSRSLSRGTLKETPQSSEVDAIFNQKKNGFFVECGAYDGETSSNSLPLEYNRQWTGVLIEPNPYYYTQILGKSRNVWSLNACLSPYNYAIEVELESFLDQRARVILNNTKENTTNFVVACIPLETILLALNRTRVDYFSLDVEGLELEVLKTIPFDRIDIGVLTVEWLHGANGKEEYKTYMESKGFRTLKEINSANPADSSYANDYIFVTK